MYLLKVKTFLFQLIHFQFSMFSFFPNKKPSFYLISSISPLKLRSEVSFEKKIYFDSLSYREEFLDREDKFLGTYYKNILDKQERLLFDSLNFEIFMFSLSQEEFSREILKFPSFSLDTQFILEVLDGDGYILLEDKETRKKVKLYELKPYQRIVVSPDFLCTLYSKSKLHPLKVIGLKDKHQEFSFGVVQKTYGPSLFYTKEGFIKNKNLSSSFELEEFFSEHPKQKDLYKEVVENPKYFSEKIK